MSLAAPAGDGGNYMLANSQSNGTDEVGTTFIIRFSTRGFPVLGSRYLTWIFDFWMDGYETAADGDRADHP